MSKLIEQIDRRNEERRFFSDVFAEAGFEHVAMDETKNRYENSYSAPPWFMVTTEMGFFVVGWRKRVIHIAWHDIELPAGHFDDLGNITHGHDHVHAWSAEKAVEYLRRIRENATRTDPHSLEWPRSVGEFDEALLCDQSIIRSMVSAFSRAEVENMKRGS